MSYRFTAPEVFGDSFNGQASQSSAELKGNKGAHSLFNKFSMFRYHRYGPTKNAYDSKFHMDKGGKGQVDLKNEYALPIDQLQAMGGQDFIRRAANLGGVLGNVGGGAAFVMKSTTNVPLMDVVTENPTAKLIIEWAKSPNHFFGPAPYSVTDFLYCKFYGKIPNNRLVTLRRFPQPVFDNMRASGTTPMVPLAQAVTWFSESTGNALKDILPFNSWDLPWKELNAQDGAQDWVTKENVTADELVQMLEQYPIVGKFMGKSAIRDAIQLVINSGKLQQGGDAAGTLGGQNQQLAEFNKTLYDSTGPKWNEVYGGVNYITQTLIRDKVSASSAWTKEVSINFHYSLKSYNGIKPKIAMLDIISNFLALTYMNMEWKGSFARFIPTQGVTGNPTIDAQITDLMFKNKAEEALKLAATVTAIQAMAGVNGLSTLIGDITDIKQLENGIVAQDNKTNKKFTLSQLVTAAATTTDAYRKIAKKPFAMRAPLTGQPTGEWHLTVGNPMDPIATIGNLVCSGCTMEFGDEIGPDDFPTEVKFTVKVKPAKPRDKYEIESMFNLGGGSLTEFFTRPPASNFNTFSGESENKNKIKANIAMQNGNTPTGLNLKMADVLDAASRDYFLSSKTRLETAYGRQYANMASLPSYFMTDQALNQTNTSK